jgi:hypothetical protein
MVWYPFVCIILQCTDIISSFLIDSSQGTMKISLAFGLAATDREVVDKVRDGIKRSCSSRHTQTWNTRRTRTPYRQVILSKHTSLEAKVTGGRNDNRSDISRTADLTIGRDRSSQTQNYLARVLGANKEAGRTGAK